MITDNNQSAELSPLSLRHHDQEALLLLAEPRIFLFHNGSPFPAHHQQQGNHLSLPLLAFLRIFS